MIIVFIRKYFNSCFLSLIIVVFSLIINYLGIYEYELYYIDANSNFNNSCIYFSVSSEEKEMALIDRSVISPETLNENVSLYTKHEETGICMYGVVFSNRKLNITEGENFSEKDFEDGAEAAVAGKFAEQIADVNNINFNGKQYTLKGVFCDDKKPSNNYTIYISENSDKLKADLIYILDGNRKKDINSAYKKISDSLGKSGYISNIIEYEEISSSNFIRYQLPIVVTGIFTVTTIVFLNFILSVFWLYSMQREIFVLYLVGKKTNIIILKKYILITLMSNILGMMISMAVIHNSDMIWISVLSMIGAEIVEIISLTLGLLYYNRLDASMLMENEYE